MTLILRDCQQAVIDEARLELRTHKKVLVQAATGFGKCLGKDTPIIMFNGSIKLVQDIKVGDFLIGPDSKKREVKSICAGKEKLYRITPNKYGDSFVCNESHILSLKRTRVSTLKNAKGYESRTKNKGDIINISVADYLIKSKTFKHIYKLWRTGVNFKNTKKLNLSPYFLGVWLGDGSSRVCGITSADDEVIQSIREEADKFSLLVREENAGGKSKTYHITTGVMSGGKVRNKVLDLLNDLNLIMNKHIPRDYLISSRKNRLELLAGIIDTDGCLIKSGFEIIQKNKVLFKDIVFLARSLGFAVSEKEVIKTCCNNGVSGTYYLAFITGDCDKIPTKIRRKKSPLRKQKKNHLVTGFKVEDLGVGDYYGFEIEGNDSLFLLGDFTVTHNTVLSAFMAGSANDKGKRLYFICHRSELIYQTHLTFNKVGIQHGFIAAGFTPDYHQRVQICSIDTLKRRFKDIPVPDICVWDEAHHVGASGWSAVHGFYSDAYHIGLSATPHRLDGKGLGQWFDKMVCGPSVSWLIGEGYLSDYRLFAPSSPDLSDVHTRMGDYKKDELNKAVDTSSLTGDIVKHYLKYARGKKTILFAVSVKHSKHLVEQFKANGIMAVHLDGTTPKEERKIASRAFADGHIDVLCNVDLFGEGYDLAAQSGRDVNIEAVILARPTQSLSLYLQQCGRSLRPKSQPAIILDHAGNAMKHGLPDQEREWSLDGEERRKKAESGDTVTVKQCPKCYHVHFPLPKCPNCGHVYVVEGRKIEEAEGELVEIDKEQMRRQAIKEQAEANSLDKLIELGRARNYKQPERWAAAVYTARLAKARKREAEKMQQMQY